MPKDVLAENEELKRQLDELNTNNVWLKGLLEELEDNKQDLVKELKKLKDEFKILNQSKDALSQNK